MTKRKISIRTKVFLEIAAIIGVCLLGISVVNSRLIESVYIWRVERTLSSIAQSAENAGGNYAYVLGRFEAEEGVSIDLYDPDDAFLYEGKGNFVSGNKLNIISRSENDDGSYFNVVSAEGSTTQFIVYGKDFKNGYHIEITAQKDPIQENATLATQVTAVISVLAMIISLVAISLYAKRFTKPLIEMSSVTSDIARLDFSRKCNVERNDEIGALAKNINIVSDSLSNALSELREKNAQLLEDIEKERRLEKMRSEFISAASHELKTPIAIIRGYAEALRMNMEDADSATAQYSDIIMGEADKMNDLVISMLEQSLYSSGGKEPNKKEFSINGLIRDFLKVALPVFDEKGVSASFEEVEDITVFADRDQYTTVLSNIVLNGCSHAKGEKLINITAEKLGDKIKVNVFNTGSFVAEKDKDSIFTSFYRADKAHSRSQGRFGLGLAIVKSITENHGCTCGFQNQEDGVTFWFTVPMKG